MTKLMRAMARPVLLGLVLFVAGCSSWSFEPAMRGNVDFAPFNLAQLKEVAPAKPTNFSQALTADYYSFATTLQDEIKDWADADYFARKGLAAARGQVVPPERNSNWAIPLEYYEKFRTQLSESRERLVRALDAGGRERMPLVAARAQVSYDCWVERMEDDWQSALDGPCHKQFLAALTELEGKLQPAAQPAVAPEPTREYRVYFEFDRSALLPEAQQILKGVTALAKQEKGLRIVLVGKADRTGSDPYNMRLSKRRAERVRDALAEMGIAVGRIETRWVGEREPPVPTPPGVREPRNRVVEINLR
jgi:OmpA-OmpF porin, OOP family